MIHIKNASCTISQHPKTSSVDCRYSLRHDKFLPYLFPYWHLTFHVPPHSFLLLIMILSADKAPHLNAIFSLDTPLFEGCLWSKQYCLSQYFSHFVTCLPHSSLAIHLDPRHCWLNCLHCHHSFCHNSICADQPHTFQKVL